MPSSHPAPPATKRGRPRCFEYDQVLEQAMRLFWDKGFAGTSMSDLTAAMGIAAPSLYAAFGSKEGLYRAAIEHYVAVHSETRSQLLALPTARESIEGILRTAVTHFASPDLPSGCMVQLSAAEGDGLSPELTGCLNDLRAANDAMFAARLQKGLENGDVRAGTDIRAVADFYATILKGLSLSARGGAGPDQLHSVVTSAMAAWGVLAGP